MTAQSRRRASSTAVVAAVLAASVGLTWAWGGLGDYPGDGGPPITDLLHGHLTAFFHRQPAMGSLALLLRLPFAALAFLSSPTPLHLYLYGAVPCVASVGLLGCWLARIARSRGAGAVGQAAIVGVCLVNPLVRSALELGHPEELLTASLAVGALVAAGRRREVLAAVLLGLALASKQWSVIVALPILLLACQRRRSLLIALGTAGGLTLPLLAGSPGSFLDTQIGLVHQQYVEPSAFSWLYPLAPSVPRHIVLDGHPAVVSVARLSPTLVGLLHPLIVVLAAALAAGLWRRVRQPTADQVFALVALIFLLRCTLDTETMPYYHAGLLLTLLAWDAVSGARLPSRALVAAAAAYIMTGRLAAAVSPATASAVYGAVTLVAACLLTGALRGRHGRPAPARPGQRAPRGRDGRQPAANPGIG